MRPIELAYSWRSWGRIAVAIVATFATGVVAATAGAPWVARIVAAILFLIGAYGVLDAVVFTSSWRLVGHELKVPTLLSRHRSIAARDDLSVALEGLVAGVLLVSGAQGSRGVRVNPLASPTDLRRWFDRL